jgi:PAS domain S-box-containing protein
MQERAASDPIERLYAVSQQIAAAPHFDGMLQAIIDTFSGEDSAASISPVSTDAIIISWTRDYRRLTILANWDRRDEYDLKNRTFDLFSYTVLNRLGHEPIIVNDIDHIDPNLPLDVQCLRDLNLCSFVLLPLVIRGKNLGVILAGSRRSNVFSLADVRSYQIIASQAGFALMRYIAEQMHGDVLNFLQKERDLLEAILETTNDAILVVDTARNILATNLQFEAFFQLARNEIINHTIDQVVKAIQDSNISTKLATILLTLGSDMNQTVGGEINIVLPSKGQRVLVWYSTLVHTSDFTHVGRLFVFRDATQEREIDQMKTQFVSLVSHELRTPLASVKGFTDFILDGDAGEISDTVRQYLMIVQTNTSRLMTLINDIIDITRVESGRIELRRDWHTIESLINASMLLMQTMLTERQQTLTIEIAPDLPAVWADRERITQVINNLLSNASKYTDKGNALRIEAKLESDNKTVIIGVHDTGMGIPDADQERIFERFYRTHEATRNQIAGSGLGLAIVKSLVDLHGGTVWVDSRVGKGSSFYFSLPQVKQP